MAEDWGGNPWGNWARHSAANNRSQDAGSVWVHPGGARRNLPHGGRAEGRLGAQQSARDFDAEQFGSVMQSATSDRWWNHRWQWRSERLFGQDAPPCGSLNSGGSKRWQGYGGAEWLPWRDAPTQSLRLQQGREWLPDKDAPSHRAADRGGTGKHEAPAHQDGAEQDPERHARSGSHDKKRESGGLLGKDAPIQGPKIPRGKIERLPTRDAPTLQKEDQRQPKAKGKERLQKPDAPSRATAAATEAERLQVVDAPFYMKQVAEATSRSDGIAGVEGATQRLDECGLGGMPRVSSEWLWDAPSDPEWLVPHAPIQWKVFLVREAQWLRPLMPPWEFGWRLGSKSTREKMASQRWWVVPAMEPGGSARMKMSATRCASLS